MTPLELARAAVTSARERQATTVTIDTDTLAALVGQIELDAARASTAIGDPKHLADVLAAAMCAQEEAADIDEQWWTWGTDRIAAMLVDAIQAELNSDFAAHSREAVPAAASSGVEPTGPEPQIPMTVPQYRTTETALNEADVRVVEWYLRRLGLGGSFTRDHAAALLDCIDGIPYDDAAHPAYLAQLSAEPIKEDDQ